MSDNWEFLGELSKQEKEELAVEALAVSVQLSIQKAMMRSSVSQKELAERLGVSTARVSQMLSKHGGNLTLSTLGRIAHALEEDFEFIALTELRELKSKPARKQKRTEKFSCDVLDFEAYESPWMDNSANENKFPWKQAA